MECSSVKAIIHSRLRGAQALASGKPNNVAAVAMQHTPKQQPLDFAGDEIKAVLATCNSRGLQHVRPQPFKNDVSSALETCWIFHFAGHGDTHPTEPLHSQLLLGDWDCEPANIQVCRGFLDMDHGYRFSGYSQCARRLGALVS
jgi:CHAT domain-containing protein